MDSCLIPLKEVTATATVPQLKYWSKLSGITMVIHNRAAYVRPEDADTLRRIATKVSDGSAPSEAVKEIVGTSDHPIIATAKPDLPAQILPNVISRLDSMEKAILLLVEENRRLSTQVLDSNTMIADLRSRLEPPTTLAIEPPKPIKAWEPIRVQPPIMPWYQRIWYEVFDPVVLRVATE